LPTQLDVLLDKGGLELTDPDVAPVHLGLPVLLYGHSKDLSRITLVKASVTK
jgi:hypothetical protein